MSEGEIWQYGLVILAIVLVISLKAYTVRKQYSQNLQQYTHPEIFLD
jgi:hypothetical protein